MPTPEKANSVMLVRPMMTAPAALSRATIGASALAGGVSSSALRSGERDFAGDIEEVLDRDRNAGERRGDITGRAQPVLRIGRGPRRLGIDLDKDAPALAGGIGDARERLFDQSAARRAPRGEIGREPRQGRPCDRAHPGIFGKRCLSPSRLTQGWALSQKISIPGLTQLASSSVPAMIIVTFGMTSASSISVDPHSGQKRR